MVYLLCSLVRKSLRDRDLNLGHAKFDYNQTPSYATKLSPFEVVYDANPYIPFHLSELHKDVYVHGDARQQARKLLEIHKDYIRKNSEKESQGYKLRANKESSHKGF